MRRLGGMAGGLLVLTALAACGTKSGPDAAVEPTQTQASEPAFEDQDWDPWTATYRDVRPAVDDLDELAQRVRDLNETSWTAEIGPRSLSIAYTPELVRVEAYDATAYLDPRAEELRDSDITVCTDTCVAASLADENPGAQGGQIPEEIGTALYLLGPQLGIDAFADQVRDYGEAFLATVDSPIGALDCFLAGPDGTTAQDIDGQPMQLDPTEGGYTPAVCIDERGLVINPPGGNVAPRYETWIAGVEGALEPTPASEPEREPDEPTDEPEVSWGMWEPAYRDARMATQEDVDTLTARIEQLNASEWTATLPEGGELAVGPDHVRAILGEVQLHLDPADLSSSVLCLADGGCVEEQIADKTEEGDFLAAMAASLVESVRAQRDPGLALTDESAYAVLDSPIGTLECVVDLGKADLRNLEGARPDTGWGEPPTGTPNEARVCVDEHGVVLLTEAVRRAPLLEVLAWQPGAPEDFDEHPEAAPR